MATSTERPEPAEWVVWRQRFSKGDHPRKIDRVLDYFGDSPTRESLLSNKMEVVLAGMRLRALRPSSGPP